MSKFKVGDAVKFKPAWAGQTDKMETPLDLCYTQTISLVNFEGDVKVLGDDDLWCASYWELVEDWEKHQRKVDPAMELELTKLQVKMLQEWKKEALYLLRHARLNVRSASLIVEITMFLGEDQ
jgi:hypothetical protein